MLKEAGRKMSRATARPEGTRSFVFPLRRPGPQMLIRLIDLLKLRFARLAPILGIGALLALGNAGTAVAQTSTWIDGNGLWSVPANWNNGVPNGSSYTAVINNGSTVTFDISPVATISQLFIDFFAPPASTLVLNGGGSPELDLDVTGIFFNNNVITVNAPGTGVLVLGSGPDINSGTLLASGGGTLEVNGAGQTINNSLGTITALNGSRFVLFGFGTTLSGGTTTTAGTGVVEIGGDLVNLSGVTNTGTFSVPDKAALDIVGSSTNAGTMGNFAPGLVHPAGTSASLG
jgi:hypothetical protein